MVPFLDLTSLRNQVRQTNFSSFYWSSINTISFSFLLLLLTHFCHIYITILFPHLPRKWFNFFFLADSKHILLIFVKLPACHIFFVTTSFTMGTCPRSQQRDSNLCTSWLGVCCSQTSSDSLTPKPLGRSVAGDNPV